MYVAEANNARVRKVTVATGMVTTVAGSSSWSEWSAGIFSNGIGSTASFSRLYDVTISHDGTTLFVADSDNCLIRQINVATGMVSTLAGSGVHDFTDGIGTAASFSYPYGVAVSSNGETLFVADYGNRRVRQIVIATRVVSTLAGSGTNAFMDGTDNLASFKGPISVATSRSSVTVFVSDQPSHRIRQVVR